MDIKAPMIAAGKKGKIGKISVSVSEKVNKDAVLANVETGKGNKPVKAPFDCIITKVLCEEGSEVATAQVLFEIEEIAAEKQTVTQEKTDKITKNIEVDTFVIGAGPGGYVAAIYASQMGQKVAIAEREYMGGTCLNVGCIPTKALVKSSEVCHSAHNSRNFGVNIAGDISVDMNRVIDRKEEVVKKLVGGIDFLMEKNRITVLKGNACFVDNNTVSVSGNENYIVKAKNIIIATGSKISKIGIPGIDLPFVLNSTTALSCREKIDSVVIIGGGVIGMEFACIYRNFGVKVDVIEYMDRLLAMVDNDVSEEIKSKVTEMGIRVKTGAKVTKIESSIDGKALVTFEDKDGVHITVSDKVLVAIGREPVVDGLGLEHTEIKMNENGRGICVDDYMRTSVPHIYAIGDVTNKIQLAHVASHQGIVAVENILGKNTEMSYAEVPNVIFTAPEIASVGMAEQQCKDASMDIKTSRFDFAGNGKALTMNEPDGFIKMIKDNKTGKIIGCSIIGADASNLIGTVTLAIKNGLTDKEITHTIFAHPTTSEVIHECAMGLGTGALHQ